MTDLKLAPIKSTPIVGAPNFTIEELCNSATARSKGIENKPNRSEIMNLEYLAVKLLQPIRDFFGEPIVVNSGFRSAALNAAVGGSPTSFHRYGMAADIQFRKDSMHRLIEIFSYVYSQLPYTELIAEELPYGWIHVAIAKGREHEKQLKYKFIGSKVQRAPYNEILRLMSV